MISEYDVPTAKPVPAMTLALVSDLHEHDPEPVLDLLRQAKPDIICVAGDTLERHAVGSDPRHQNTPRHKQRLLAVAGALPDLVYLVAGSRETGNTAIGHRFFLEAGQIAPVFMSLGNHEWYLTKADREVLQASNVTVLDNRDVQWGGLRLGGLSPCADAAWLAEFQRKDGYKMLLCHHPEYYEKYGLSGLDLVLSGHAHGGQWRICGRGILAPDQGLFPKYSHGIYHGNFIVSAGCANTTAFPRFGNPCEVIITKIKCSG